jgi:hypothetical protein
MSGSDRQRDLAVVTEILFEYNQFFSESLILAQNERWRRASYMQVERESQAPACRDLRGKRRTGE